MDLHILYGIMLISFGALMSGSFAIPFDKVKNWNWENYWLIFSLFAYVIVPAIVCATVVPGFISVITHASSGILLLVFLLGAIYGAANLAFGLSLRYLGMALGFALSLGLMMAIGTIVPPMIDGRLAALFTGNGGLMLVAGIVVSLTGIGVSGYAGILKSRETATSGGINQDFNIKKGLAAALFVGITGSATALGIEQGFPLASASEQAGASPLFRDCVVFLVLYSGSFLTTLVWCLFLSIRGGTLKRFVKPVNNSLTLNYLFCGLAGFLWYINYVFFGMGRSQMGAYSFVGWGVLMSMTIVFATLWGLYRGEWKGVTAKVKRTMWLGLVILIASSFMIAISGNM